MVLFLKDSIAWPPRLSGAAPSATLIPSHLASLRRGLTGKLNLDGCKFPAVPSLFQVKTGHTRLWSRSGSDSEEYGTSSHAEQSDSSFLDVWSDAHCVTKPIHLCTAQGGAANPMLVCEKPPPSGIQITCSPVLMSDHRMLLRWLPTTSGVALICQS